MKKSFEETIQYMREQNWIKEWLRCKNITSLEEIDTEMNVRYLRISRGNITCSIVWGVNPKFVEKYGADYVRSIRASMHKWMFNIEG